MQDAVDAEVEFGQIQFQDVALQQVQKALLGGQGGAAAMVRVRKRCRVQGRLARWVFAASASFSSKVASGALSSAASQR